MMARVHLTRFKNRRKLDSINKVYHTLVESRAYVQGKHLRDCQEARWR